MTEKTHNFALRVIKIFNVILLTIPFACCWYFYYASRIVVPFYNKGNWVVVLLFALLYTIFGRVYDAFIISVSRISEIVYSQALALLASDFIMYVVTCLLIRHFSSPVPLVGAFAFQIVLSMLWSLTANWWYFLTSPRKKTAIVYDARQGLETLIGQYGLSKKFDVRTTMSVEDCLQNIDSLQEIDTVFLSGIHSHDRNIILKYCVNHRIFVYVIPRVGDVIMSGARQTHMFHLPVLQVGRYNPSPLYLFAKRLGDMLVSGIALVLLLPIFLITAVLIKVTDGGPVFYKQERLTRDGKAFHIHKFRSMRVDAEKDGVARLSTGDNDSRITPIGRIIRKVRIDELPQLVDVFTGNLSLVGPRPERPEICAQYEQEMPEFKLRLQATAGLTGYAQVYGKYNTTPYDKLLMDLTYIAHPSLLEDLKIMLATIKILFMPDSTEGIAEGSTTAMGQADEANDEVEKHTGDDA